MSVKMHKRPSFSSTVSLPSIHEMFPEYLMQMPPHMRVGACNSIFRKSRRSIVSAHPYSPSSVAHSPPFSRRVRHAHSSSIRPTPFPSPATSSSTLRSHPTPHSSPSPPSPPSATNIDFKFHNFTPDSSSPPSPYPRQSSSPTPSEKPICSFDVLRSDPTRSSLEHIASSSTFPNRGAGTNQSSPAGIANGSAPAFRVTLLSTPSTEGPVEKTSPGMQEGAIVASPGGRENGSEANPRSLPSPSYSTIISFPASGPPANSNANSRTAMPRDQSPEDTGTTSDDGYMSSGDNSKKHVCPHCLKRFNRPSSLRIHVNTHTGATPFRCPWPNCGREFNVNSNMRRHYRNHAAPGFSRAHPRDNRRRRRRVSTGLVFVGDATPPASEKGSFLPSPPISSLTMSEDSGDDMSASADGTRPKLEGDEEDELLEYESLDGDADERQTAASGSTPAHLIPRSPPRIPAYNLASRNDFSHSHTRSIPAISSGPPTSPSVSPPPSQRYAPSAAYVRSFADSRVSTALRPAFISNTSTNSQSIIKREEPPTVLW